MASTAAVAADWPQNHEYRLHPDRPVGNVRTRHANRHQQVAAFAFLGQNGPVRNRIGFVGLNTDVAFVLHEPIFFDVPLGIHLGSCYLFSEKVGGFAEIDYGVSALRLGVAAKF